MTSEKNIDGRQPQKKWKMTSIKVEGDLKKWKTTTKNGRQPKKRRRTKMEDDLKKMEDDLKKLKKILFFLK